MKITLPLAPTTSARTDHRAPGLVLGLDNPFGAPSARGSTYWSRLMTCPREHALHNLAGLRSERPQMALTVGFLVHHGLEVYYRSLMESQRPWRAAALADLEVKGDYPISPDDDRAFKQAAADAAFASLTPLATEPGYEQISDQVDRILSGYFDLALLDQHMVLAVEENLEHIRRSLAYTARIDLLVQDYGERRGVWIVEHKTAKALNESLIEGYQLNLQILGQVWLFKKVFDSRHTPVYRGVLVQILTKTAVPKYHRVHVTPSPAHLSQFEESLKSWKAIEKTMSKRGWPANFTKCAGYARGYSRCVYYNLCHSMPDASIEELTTSEPPLGYVRDSNPDTDSGEA